MFVDNRLLILASLVFCVGGCATKQATAPTHNSMTIAFPGQLRIVNTSENPIDIRIEINGRVLFNELCWGGRNSTIMGFLPTGEHTVNISSTKTNTKLLQEISAYRPYELSVVYTDKNAQDNEPHSGEFVVQVREMASPSPAVSDS